MQNIRIVNVQVTDNSNIDVTFTHELTINLVTSNVSIISDNDTIPSPDVLDIKISRDTLSINCQPMTPLAAYFLQFQSTPSHPFQSVNGDAIIQEDGVSNRVLIIGPIGADNPVKNFFTSFLKDNIYNTEDNTIVAKYLNSLAVNMSRALYDIRQVKNENYLSFTTTDERKVRGAGPFDRLNEEGAYEVTRVGRAPSSSNANTAFVFDDFPSFPITLQRQIAQETLTPSSSNIIGEFNINSLTLNLKHFPITKVNSIVFTFTTLPSIYTYDIETFGYQITDSRYDQDFGFSYALLENNQIRISDRVLENPDFSLDNILRIDVIYEYKNLGIVVNEPSVSVHATLDAVREVLPPIVNVFSLQHAPIVDGNGNVSSLGGVSFSDPNSGIVGAKHPAFLSEIPFRLNGLPSLPGQYAIDYSVGQVYVYGNNSLNDGTGPSPPLATYRYRLNYKPEQDYVFDADLMDLVALPLGNLIDSQGVISFNYEEVLVKDVDYKAALHQEALTERVDNRLVALNTIRVRHAPITNVFRIFNETSGEIYTLNRWNNDKIYFRFNTPPRLNAQTSERVTFKTITNELLFVNTTLINASSLRVFRIFLSNDMLASSTEDSLASSFNTSLHFSDAAIFESEKWFNRQENETSNIDKLNNVGEYNVDYVNGVIYVAVSNTQGLNIGTASYKTNQIVPQFPHLISVNDIYYRISALNPKNKSFAYTSFEDGSIIPEILEPSSELFLNGNVSAPYQIFGGKIGVFAGFSFVPGLTNQIKTIRSIYEYNDLLNSTNPLNFANISTSEDFNVSVSPINKQVFKQVQFDGSNYFVIIDENIPYLSPNITYTFSVVRTSDNAQLWDNTGTIVPGNPVKLVLSGINSPSIGDLVNITYSFTINDLSRVVVDYNKGDLFVDYTYLADEIIVSYEYGDNVLDFRTNKNLPEGSEYFVSYKAGALRDALLKNFGTLVNIPELANFEVDFDRERYREALMAALSSFIQGPTVAAIKNIGKTISHIEPKITESIFEGWSLGSSLLNPEHITTRGDFQLLPAKFGNGVLINNTAQSIGFPVNSNLRLEAGTFETWIVPQWSGLDNDATLTFKIARNGSNIDPLLVFIGSSEHHPVITNGSFTVNKTIGIGKPNKNKDGIFIYYDNDTSGNFNRWYVETIDGYTDGYSASYSMKISSTGSFYDVKSLTLPRPSNLSIFTGTSSVNVTINSAIKIDEGITFLSDVDHYLLDFGKEKNKDRLSLYKDVSGYFNFRVFDRDKLSYTVSADVSAWSPGSLHHVAASWKLNTHNNRDEMHLFLDGLEVPNIIRYGQKLRPYLHEKFRTVDPEEIVGPANRDIVASVDLQTTAGSDSVSSSINFGAFNIFVGDTIFIDEMGFSSSGYTIIGINGQTLALSSNMPLTLTNGRFSINRTQFTITSDIDIAPNIAVSTIHLFTSGTDLTSPGGSDTVTSGSSNFITLGVKPGYSIRIDDPSLPLVITILQVNGTSLVLDDTIPTLTGVQFYIYSNTEQEIPGVRALRPSYSISKDVNFNNILTISNDVTANDLILIRTLGLNHRKVKKQYYVWSDGYENILMTRLPPPISLDEAKITKIILPTVAIGSGNSTLTSGIFVSNNLVTAQPSNTVVGRTISITLSGTNVDFSTPPQITISGTSNSLPTTETIVFTDYGTMDSVNIYTHIDYINATIKPVNTSKNAANIEAREKYTITHSEADGYAPIIRYSYHIGSGYDLHNDGTNAVRDENNTFSGLDINNYLVIYSPPSAAGYYIITGLSADRKSITIQSTSASPPLPLSSFTGGIYQILNTTQFRSGLQNGFFTFEQPTTPGQPYLLGSGFYEVEYSTYARIKLDPLDNDVFLGSDFTGRNTINAILDQVKAYSVMLTDTRIGETIPANQRSITKDFNSLKPLKVDINTLALINFDSFPFVNSSRFYFNARTDKRHFHTSSVINESFDNATVIADIPIIVPNDGVLDTKKEGTIEFWVSPIFDTGNDPNERFYFDAFGATLEETISVNNASVKISAPASQILSVKLKNGDPSIDYFAGGKLEIDTQRAVQESATSLSSSVVVVSKFILQVISVKIADDLTGTDYFEGGAVSTDRQTIYLGKMLPANNLLLTVTYQTTENDNDSLNTQVIRLNRKLPNQNSHVVVSYIPRGLQGDRIALYKDNFGYVNFAISASGTDYLVRAPTRWAQNTWHRIKASYKINGGKNSDEIRLFLDGYEFTNVLFGTGLVFGDTPIVFGSSMPGDGYGIVGNIRFKDPINDLFIGSKYTGESPIFSAIDNFRISNVSRPIYAPYGEPLDVNYSSNLGVALPVTEDLFTTYLLDFDSLIVLNDNFTTLKNKKTGLFDFSVEIIDSFDIVINDRVREVLEKLLKVLKPANSRMSISYIR